MLLFCLWLESGELVYMYVHACMPVCCICIWTCVCLYMRLMLGIFTDCYHLILKIGSLTDSVVFCFS